jgi:glycosyltransferase involved in cell wall biosynthesis
MTSPLVSCVMPTKDRPAFVVQAIGYFLRQDYPHRELVIVDDGIHPVGDLVPADPRIRYLRLDRPHRLGAKRNLACQASRGELIAHWDDDDWMRADRLSRQVSALTASEADVCGLSELLCLRPLAGDAWRYRPAPLDPPWLAGATLLFRRSAWQTQPFPEIDVGEDTTFIRRLGRLCALDDPRWYVALLHPGNSGPKGLGDERWQPADYDEVVALLTPDRAFYAALRAGRTVTAEPPTRPGGTVTLVSDFFVYDGYAGMAEYLALGMCRAGAQVNLAPITVDIDGLSTPLREMLVAARPEASGPVLYSSFLRPELERYANREHFVHTMWESSRLPAAWPAKLNRARAVLVPTRFVADVCRASGVTVPIAVVPDGADPAVYPLLDRPAREGLTTLIVGTLLARKHLTEAVSAWRLAFPDPEARLVFKSRFGQTAPTGGDPRITVVSDSEPTRGIAHWYQRADILLALGNEGFGLPVIEAMATGLPVVALDSEGQADTCRDARGLVLAVPPARFEPCHEPGYGECGVRAVPDVAAVAQRLRWVATHREEAAAMGRAASAWAHRHRDVWQKGPAALSVMEEHTRPRRPLRPRRAVWVPSWGGRCGVAEHAAALLRLAPRAFGTAVSPDPGAVSLVHVEHEDGLFRDAELTTQVTRLHAAAVPVLITEHSVRDGGRAFEAPATTLVALTPAGAQRLRERWPGKRVEYVPPGCPTWFPRRKRGRGRVIGAFGFLAPYKGFQRLLELLRELPGTELLLFSHARSEDSARSFAAARAGRPVRWERRYRPDEEIARRLAAEADVLVFWYDDVPHLSASGAVRVGLASGVPVLTSPTSWFADLVDVTYQPADLRTGVARLLDDTPLRRRITANARDFCHQHTWRRTADRYAHLWETTDSGGA